MTNLHLTYCTRYNGWIVDPENDDLESDLADFTADFCDEDGEFEYGEFTTYHLDEIDVIVKKHYSDAEYIIEFDHHSS